MFLLLESHLKTPRIWKTQRRGNPGLGHVTRRAACCGGAGSTGSKAPLQRPDAPQRRTGGNADSAGGVEGWGGDKSKFEGRWGNLVCRRLKSEECSRK